MNLNKSLEQFFTNHELRTQQLVLGLSGGIDSVVLLDLLIKSSYDKDKILAVHVNHGISEQSHHWQRFCEALCRNNHINVISEQVTLTDLGLGLEGAARKARYQALSKHMTSTSVLLTAQHQDDQCETLLLALKRGSGVLGLAGMLPLTTLVVGEHARPLLDVRQQVINDYATANHLTWVEDDSNRNTHFDRNFLRHDIITKLNERWPSFSANAARSATLCQQQMALSQEIAQADFLGNEQPKSQLSMALLNQLSDARVNNLIRYWLTINDVTLPSFKQLEEIKSQCFTGRDDANPLIEIGSKRVRRYLGHLYITDDCSDTLKMSIDCHKLNDIQLPHHLGRITFNQPESMTAVMAPQHHQKVTIEFGLSGSYKAWPVNRDKRRALKKLWQEYKIPPWQRSHIAYLCYDGVLVTAIGYWIETDFAVDVSALSENVEVMTVGILN